MQDISHKEANKTSCQMLLMAEYDWFAEFSPNGDQDVQEHGYVMDLTEKRLAGYNACKAAWQERALSVFLRYFPKVT